MHQVSDFARSSYSDESVRVAEGQRVQVLVELEAQYLELRFFADRSDLIGFALIQHELDLANVVLGLVAFVKTVRVFCKSKRVSSWIALKSLQRQKSHFFGHICCSDES